MPLTRSPRVHRDGKMLPRASGLFFLSMDTRPDIPMLKRG
jgi:hypothetical protein